MTIRSIWQGRRHLRSPLFVAALVGLALGLHTWLPQEPRWTAHGSFDSVKFSPDGARVLTVSNPYVQLWDLATGRLLLEPTARATILYGGEVSADFRRWVGVVAIGDAPTPQLVIADLESSQTRSMAIQLQDERIGDRGVVQISPRGDLVCVNTMPLNSDVDLVRDGHVLLLEMDTGKRVARLPRTYHGLARFTPRGDYFVFAHSYDQGKTQQVGVWDISTRGMVLTIEHAEPNSTMTPDGKSICRVEFDDQKRCRVTTWDVPSGNSRVLFEGQGIHTMHVSPDGKLLAMREYPIAEGLPVNTVTVCDIGSGKQRGAIAARGLGNPFFTADGSQLMIADVPASDIHFRMFEARTMTVLCENSFPGFHDGPVAFHDDASVSVIDWDMERAVVLDAATGTIRASVQLGPVPAGMAFTRENPGLHGSCLRASSQATLGGNMFAPPPPPKGIFAQWLDEVLFHHKDEREYRENIIDVRSGRVVFRSTDPVFATGRLSPDGQTLLIHDDRDGRHEIRCYDVPERKPLRWVFGIPLALGVLLVSLRAGWCRLRRRPAVQPVQAPPTPS